MTAIGRMAGATSPVSVRPKAASKGAGRALAALTRDQTALNGRTPKPPSSTATERSRTAIPRGASFRSLTHVGAFGRLDYKLYTPAGAARAARPLPLLVLLHGCGQTPDDFAAGTGMNALAEELGVLVAYPAQSRGAHRTGCWNWYRRGDQDRDAGEPALLASLVRDVLSSAPANPARVYVAGLSAGTSMASILGATYPDLFAAIGLHSGLVHGAARDQTTAALAMRHSSPGRRAPGPMPTIAFHGAEDKVVHLRNGRYVSSRATDAYTGLRRTVVTGSGPGGYRYERQSYRRGTGRSFTEFWIVGTLGHAWSGGSRAGRFTDPAGPDASREMLRFFLQHRTTIRQRTSAIAA